MRNFVHCVLDHRRKTTRDRPPQYLILIRHYPIALTAVPARRIVDVYALDRHSGLFNRSPRFAFDEIAEVL